MKTAFSSFIYSRRGIYGILHILILLMSLFLVISISIDTFHNIPFLNQGSYKGGETMRVKVRSV